MSQVNLTVTTEERDYLQRVLQKALEEVRVEVHRTHTPDFRQQVLKEEELIRGLLAKVKTP
jgi:DNA-directed RNA polymerase beta' subunit